MVSRATSSSFSTFLVQVYPASAPVHTYSTFLVQEYLVVVQMYTAGHRHQYGLVPHATAVLESA
eukprot:3547147-Rhodomonas_salina.1